MAASPQWKERCRVCNKPITSAELCTECARGNDPFKTADNCGADMKAPA